MGWACWWASAVGLRDRRHQPERPQEREKKETVFLFMVSGFEIYILVVCKQLEIQTLSERNKYIQGPSKLILEDPHVSSFVF
jgi:hypothetical protein